MKKYHVGNPISPDSKFMQIMNRVCDLLILNILFLLCSIPVFTIGASAAALYTVCFRFDTNREGGTVKDFFKAFRSNFRQATVLWLIILLCGGSALINVAIFYLLGGPLRYCCILFGVLFVIALFTGSYAFPLLTQFSNDNRSTLKNALLLSIGFFPRSILISVINIFPFALLLGDMLLFLQTGFIWVIVYFSAAAYINTLVLRPVFARYTPPEEESDE